MAQIIKHRRGSITQLKDVTARAGEMVVATGSIGTMNGPWVFIGSDEIAGGYKPVSKIYEGSTVPTIGAGSYGTTVDGTPFYSTTDEALFILASGGNRKIDLTGNIEGNVTVSVGIFNSAINYFICVYINICRKKVSAKADTKRKKYEGSFRS